MLLRGLQALRFLFARETGMDRVGQLSEGQ